MTSARTPPSLPPRVFNASVKPSRSSTPGALAGPLRVVRKPILTTSAACALKLAPVVSASKAAPAIVVIRFMPKLPMVDERYKIRGETKKRSCKCVCAKQAGNPTQRSIPASTAAVGFRQKCICKKICFRQPATAGEIASRGFDHDRCNAGVYIVLLHIGDVLHDSLMDDACAPPPQYRRIGWLLFLTIASSTKALIGANPVPLASRMTGLAPSRK